MLRRWPYRARQLYRSLGARPTPAGLLLAQRYLSADEYALFRATSPRDQWHHIRTLALLPAELRGDRELARAALLHDVGKGFIRLHERVIYVLLSAAAPPVVRWLTGRPRRGPVGALYRIHHHGQLAVEMLRPLGASPRELALILRHHEQSADDPVLAALILADDGA